MKSLPTLQEEIRKRFRELIVIPDDVDTFLDSSVAEAYRAGIEAAKEALPEQVDEHKAIEVINGFIVETYEEKQGFNTAIDQMKSNLEKI